MAPEDRQRVWASLETMALSPDDPEVVRLLVTEFTRTTLNALSANLEQATTRALNAFETAQSQAEATAQARLAARQAELVQTLTRSIADLSRTGPGTADTREREERRHYTMDHRPAIGWARLLVGNALRGRTNRLS
jgi:hypothetical protein